LLAAVLHKSRSALVFAAMNQPDDLFGSQPIPEDACDASFTQFISGLAGDDGLDDELLWDQLVPSAPIPLPYTASMGPPEARSDFLQPCYVTGPLNDATLPSAAEASGTCVNRTYKTAIDRLEKLRAKNRRGQAKYREKCKVLAPILRLLSSFLELCIDLQE
jgi:hypothetical protein